MKLNRGIHLAYCTNIHRGETWEETFHALKTHTLAVRDRVSPGEPYAIGLRLSDLASKELSERAVLTEFRRWLDRAKCYVFTINGFPFGQFHATRVKEGVYRPDWAAEERLEYTNRLFDILGEILPAGMEGSVSTLPGSFKEFIADEEQLQAIRKNLGRCVEHIARVSERKRVTFHLGLEPEPLGLFETTAETVEFFNQLREGDKARETLYSMHLGVNYDTCHLAVEFEDPRESIPLLCRNNIRISKLHLSSALRVRPTDRARARLVEFAEDTYLHQVVVRRDNGEIRRYKDLTPALDKAPADGEWRIHFHIPLNSKPKGLFLNTTDHLLGVLDILKMEPRLCSHLEMETYTWEVMPGELKQQSVEDQLEGEYRWCLAALEERGLAGKAAAV